MDYTRIELQPAKLDEYRRTSDLMDDVRLCCRKAVANRLLSLIRQAPLDPDDTILLRMAYGDAILQAARRFSEKYAFVDGMPLLPTDSCVLFEDLIGNDFGSVIDDLRFLTEGELQIIAGQSLALDKDPLFTKHGLIDGSAHFGAEVLESYRGNPAFIAGMMQYLRAATAEALLANGYAARRDPGQRRFIQDIALCVGAERYADKMTAGGVDDSAPREMYEKLFLELMAPEAGNCVMELSGLGDTSLAAEVGQALPDAAAQAAASCPGVKPQSALLDELIRHMRYHAALALLEIRRLEPHRQLSECEHDIVRRDAVIMTGETLGRHHDFSLGGADHDTRWLQSIDAVERLARGKLRDIISDHFFHRSTRKLAFEIARQSPIVINGGRVLPANRPGLTDAVKWTADIILKAHGQNRPATDISPIFHVLPAGRGSPVERLQFL